MNNTEPDIWAPEPEEYALVREESSAPPSFSRCASSSGMTTSGN
ncbi:hypothetical protein [Saccharopolyspora sp. ASAGF58]|nr:hypothetical protein [Saccharopolyspora sp. ASAGF58]